MAKSFLVRLPDWAGEEIKQMSERKGLAFATCVRYIVVEYLRCAPATACKHGADAASTLEKQVSV